MYCINYYISVKYALFSLSKKSSKIGPPRLSINFFLFFPKKKRKKKEDIRYLLELFGLYIYIDFFPFSRILYLFY